MLPALRSVPLLLLGLAAFNASPARAQAPAASFALIVGSNAPGPGQQRLRYAEQDAAAMAAMLRDVGGYPATNVVTEVDPDRAQLAGGFRKIGQTKLVSLSQTSQSRIEGQRPSD